MAAAQTAHLVLPDTQTDPSQNQKSRFYPRTNNDNDDIKLNLANYKKIKY